jgi:prepilin-type N-terminal cleavage/methylation domain-containing protein
MRHRAGIGRGGGARCAGLTLLELLIVLAVIGVVVFIALPTLKPSDTEARTEFVKTELRYLYNAENNYFVQYGKYVPFDKIASDPQLGGNFDQRFKTDPAVVHEVKFHWSSVNGAILEITADLPDGTGYLIDQKGDIKQYTSTAATPASIAPTVAPGK